MEKKEISGTQDAILHDNNFLTPKEKGDNQIPFRYSLIILNCQTDGSLFSHLWESAQLRVCADGGACRVYEHFSSDRNKYIPNAIVGDFDSAPRQIIDFYKQNGSEIVHEVDDNTTDLEKCLNFLLSCKKKNSSTSASKKGDNVVLYGAFGGRFDQTIAAINALYKNIALFNRLVLFSEGNFAELLQPGTHVINCNPKVEVEGTTCGILPIGGPCRKILTSGLKWNLNGERMEFGGLISTSNLIVEKKIIIETSDHVVWTTSPRL